MRRPNTDVVIYHSGHNPPGPADATLRVYLADRFLDVEASEGDADHRWTALLECPLDADLRDDYPTASTQYVYVVNADGTTGQGYRVVFVERVRGLGVRGQDFKRAFLERVLQVTTPIRTTCCTNGLPTTLYATFGGGGGSIALTWTDHHGLLFAGGGWVGYGVRSGCGAGYCLGLYCDGDTWRLYIVCHAGDDGFNDVCYESGPIQAATSVTCDPFSATFAHPTLDDCPDCDQTVTITVTT
jgi:hypothetical protein